MISTNELRIGNYVNLIAEGHENQPDTFKWDIEDYEFYQSKMDFIKPIPLTEEWLLKFGFGQMRNKFYKKHVTLTKSEGFYVAFVQDELKSVHQLQNLYFALTGEELSQVSEGEK